MNRETARTVLVVFAAALAARLLYLFEFQRSVFFSVPLLDAAWHEQWAGRVAQGHLLDGAPYFRAPLYAWILALLQTLFGGGPWAPRLAQALLGAATAAGVAWAAARLIDRRSGLAAGLIVAFYGPLIFTGGELLHETLVTALLTGLFVLLVQGQLELDDPDAGTLPWFLAALCLGFAAITRPNALAVLPALLAAPWLLSKSAGLTGRARRLLVPMAFGVLLPILPVTAINFIASGDLVWIASQGGINFYAGNNGAADGRSVIVPELSGTGGWEDFVPRVREIAERAEGRKLRPSGVSDYWAGRAWSWIRENPAAAGALTLRKLGALLGGYEIPNNRDIGVARHDSLLLSILVGRAGPFFYPWGLLLPLAAMGLWLAPDRRRLFGAWAPALLFALSLLPFFICDRFRLPLVPFLAVPAGLALVRLPELLARPARWRGALAAGGVALLLTLPTWGASTGGAPADAWHKLGEALYNKGEYSGSVEAFNEALRFAPDDPVIRLARAYALQGVGADSLAEIELTEVARRLPESWQAQYGCGLSLPGRPGGRGHPVPGKGRRPHARTGRAAPRSRLRLPGGDALARGRAGAVAGDQAGSGERRHPPEPRAGGPAARPRRAGRIELAAGAGARSPPFPEPLQPRPAPFRPGARRRGGRFLAAGRRRRSEEPPHSLAVRPAGRPPRRRAGGAGPAGRGVCARPLADGGGPRSAPEPVRGLPRGSRIG